LANHRFLNHPTTVDSKVITKLATKVVKSDSLSTPLVTPTANCSINPLISKVNNPNVKKLIGKVNNINTGFTNKFSNPKIKTKTKALQIDSTLNPGTK
jgi:hypothetical protein